jgi:hypothetical protein
MRLAWSMHKRIAFGTPWHTRTASMAKGWTVEVITQDRGFRSSRRRHQFFDVAIEDKDKAVEAVRHHLWARPDAQIAATGELHAGLSLSPGRVRCR